jgi:hypothetical protein
VHGIQRGLPELPARLLGFGHEQHPTAGTLLPELVAEGGTMALQDG